MEARNIANPTIRTASGEAEPVKPTSRARVKATLLDGATLAIETTKSPHRFTAFAFRPTGSCDSLTETTAVPPSTLARMSDRQIGYVSTIVKSRQVGVKVGYGRARGGTGPAGAAGRRRGNDMIVATMSSGRRDCGNHVVGRAYAAGQVVTERKARQEGA